MKKGLLQVLLANMLCMLVSILTNFILPRYLSMETYNVIKSYALYLGYAGLFTFGYTDGIYLKYGGRKIEEVDEVDFNKNFFTYFIFQMIISLVILLGAAIKNNELMIAFSIGLLVTNLGGYFKILYQAMGVFGKYGMALNLEKILVFFVNILLIFLLCTDNSTLYLAAQIFGGVITFGYLFYTYKGYSHHKMVPVFSFKTLYENIKTGFVLTVGGIADILFTGLDRWFIKILMGTTEFALYSFAVSLENIISTFTAPLSITFYNYFCKGLDYKAIRKIKSALLLFGFVLLAAIFPVKWIVNNYIRNYIKSIDVVFYLFAAQFFYMIVRSIYVNLYKAQKKQKEYLRQIVIMLLVAFMTNGVFYIIVGKMESFAIATSFTSILWFAWCEFKHAEIRFETKEYLCIILILTICGMCEMFLPAELGLLVYLSASALLSFVFLRETVVYCIEGFKQIVQRYLGRRKD